MIDLRLNFAKLGFVMTILLLISVFIFSISLAAMGHSDVLILLLILGAVLFVWKGDYFASKMPLVFGLNQKLAFAIALYLSVSNVYFLYIPTMLVNQVSEKVLIALNRFAQSLI